MPSQYIGFLSKLVKVWSPGHLKEASNKVNVASLAIFNEKGKWLWWSLEFLNPGFCSFGCAYHINLQNNYPDQISSYMRDSHHNVKSLYSNIRGFDMTMWWSFEVLYDYWSILINNIDNVDTKIYSLLCLWVMASGMGQPKINILQIYVRWH